jgi:LysM repeat protein
MGGGAVVAGTDALHAHTDTMADIVECDGEVGAQSEEVEVWPSPAPLPSNSPLPSLRPKVVIPVNLTSNATVNMTQPKQPPIIEAAPAPSCDDDEAFMDSKGLNCRDYTMNKELCKLADRYINRHGKTARHACCKCGGGKHVTPELKKKCVRPPMGGDEGCTEERVLAIREDNSSPVLGVDQPDPEMTQRMGGSATFDDVAAEDEIEENALDSLGTVGSMDGVLGPDSVVFRDRNFIGHPREPDATLVKPSGIFSVVGTVKFNLPYDYYWESVFGSRVVSALAASASVPPHTVTLTSVTSGSVVVEYRIVPEDSSKEGALSTASILMGNLQSGVMRESLTAVRFPKANVTIVKEPNVVEVLTAIEANLGELNVHKQYSTTTYVVEAKDTVASIAKKFNVAPSLLVSFNEDVADPSLIKAGDILLIPVPRVVTVTSIEPSDTPLEGGVEVVLSGSGFVHPAYCQFGDHITRASYVTDEKVVCVTPEQKEPGFYPVSISDGKGGFITTPVNAHYSVGMIPFCDEPGAKHSWCRPRLAIYAVSPIRIPQDTPTTVEIIGAGFNSSTICVIGDVARPTTVWSRTNLTCSLPAMPPSVHKIVLRQESLSASTQYEIVVFSTLTVTAVEPVHGAAAGGNVVMLTGTTFKPGAYCRFGEIMVPGTILSPSSMRCIAPPSEPRVVNLDVTNDGHTFSPTSLPYEYTYLDLKRLSKQEGRVSGGDIITLTGYGFYPNAWCRFGQNMTISEYVNLTTIRCKTPPQGVSSVVRVAVSLDGTRGWTESEVYYKYFSELTELRPSEGRSIGGEDIHVFGEGFDPFCSYSCRFGDISVPAIVITSTQVQCTSPPGVGTVDFALESKDYRYRVNAVGELLRFTYHGAQDIDVFAAFPSHTDVRTPNTSVVLKGSGFTQGTLCRFGDKVSLSTFIDSKTIKCTAPMRDLAEIVPVFVSHDGGLSWSSTLTYFEYRAVVEYLDPPLGYVKGGEIITVKGYGFNYRVSLCIFGNQIVSANVSTQFQLTCVAPPSEGPAKVPFAVTSNTSTLHDQYLEFRFKHPEATEWGTWYLYSVNPKFYVRSVEPPAASTMGGTPVLVHGEGFDRTSHCLFGDLTVKAQFLDAATVRCITPPHSIADVDFSVVMFNRTHGYNVSALSAPFTFAPPLLKSIEPSEGYVTGGQVVNITGEYLAGAIECRFGKYTVLAQRVTNTMVQCVTPAYEHAAIAPVELVYGGAGCSSGEIVFIYHPAVTSINPKSGYILNDKQVLVFQGSGFSGDTTQCVFDGTTLVPATIVSDTEVRCVVPLQTVPHTASVWLTNSRQSTLGGQVFKFTYNHVIQDMHPNVGSTTGGTTIVVVGSGFSSVTHCRFDGESVSAYVVSNMMVRCESPFHAPGVVSVTLESNSQDSDTHFISNPFEFTYKVMSTRVDSVFPTTGSTSGGGLVTIRGGGFTLGSFCRFGEIEVPVVYFSPDHVACYSPAVQEPQTVPLEVSQIGGGEGYSSDGHTFTFHVNVSTVNRIDPDYGEEGDEITVTGYGFTAESLCFIGGRQALGTTFVSEAQLKCVVPPIGTKSQEVIQVTSDPNHLPGGHVIFHYSLGQSSSDTPAVRELVPSSGPTSGGTLVTVRGVNFPEQAMCRFGDLTVPATRVSSTELQCTSPQHRTSSVVVEVLSSDKELFSSSFIRFTYQSASETPVEDPIDAASATEPGLERVTPQSARPGERITLIGQSFSSVGFCVFHDSQHSQQVQALVGDSSHVTCEVPQLPSGFAPNVSVKYVAINGLSSRSLPFTYVL